MKREEIIKDAMAFWIKETKCVGYNDCEKVVKYVIDNYVQLNGDQMKLTKKEWKEIYNKGKPLDYDFSELEMGSISEVNNKK